MNFADACTVCGWPVIPRDGEHAAWCPRVTAFLKTDQAAVHDFRQRPHVTRSCCAICNYSAKSGAHLHRVAS